MAVAYFRFYEELNDFLRVDRQRQCFTHAFEHRVSVKDIIESFGVPHTEVDLILVDGKSVDFTHIVNHGERISVYPVFESIDITPLLKLRPRPLRTSRFVLDGHLGKLARYLRLFGFDSLYRNDYEDEHLARIASRQHRIVLTRDRGLLKRRCIVRGCYIREKIPKQQLHELFVRLDLARSARPYSRCLRCNGVLRAVAKNTIWQRLEPNTCRYFNDFKICENCDQIYWRGSHFLGMERLVTDLLQKFE